MANKIFQSWFFKVDFSKIKYIQINRVSVLLEYIKQHLGLIQGNLDLRNHIFPFLDQIIFDLGKIYFLDLNMGDWKNVLCWWICKFKIFLKSRFHCTRNLEIGGSVWQSIGYLWCPKAVCLSWNLCVGGCSCKVYGGKWKGWPSNL